MIRGAPSAARLAAPAAEVGGVSLPLVARGDRGENEGRAPLSARRGALFHPAVDFLLVGGASLLVLPPTWLLGEAERGTILRAIGSIAVVLVTLVNYPHFAHSYQLLYEGFGRRILGAGLPPRRRLRYIWAGIVAPVAIAAGLFAAAEWGGARTLGTAANVMGFLVGWHYVKQGYGILLLLSARAGAGFDARERAWFWRNGMAVWIYSWMALNQGIHESTLLGVPVRTLDVPETWAVAAAAVAAATTLAVAVLLLRRVAGRRRPVSLSGLAGYLCALYLWVVARYSDPVFALLVPVFHSLQYLPFVWRRRLGEWSPGPGEEAAAVGAGPFGGGRLAVFVVVGTALGWLGFVGFPTVLQRAIAPDPEVFGPEVFAFLFFVWINVHHYLIDNVIWRGDEESVRRLLAAR